MIHLVQGYLSHRKFPSARMAGRGIARGMSNSSFPSRRKNGCLQRVCGGPACRRIGRSASGNMVDERRDFEEALGSRRRQRDVSLHSVRSPQRHHRRGEASAYHPGCTRTSPTGSPPFTKSPRCRQRRPCRCCRSCRRPASLSAGRHATGCLRFCNLSIQLVRRSREVGDSALPR